MPLILVFDPIENKHTLDCRKNCIWKHTKNVIGFGNNVLPLTKEELKSHRDAKVCYSCGKKTLKKLSKNIYY